MPYRISGSPWANLQWYAPPMVWSFTHRLSATCADSLCEIAPIAEGAGSMWLWRGNLLREEPPAAPGPLVCWSGWLTEDADPAAGWFGLDPQIWGPKAWERFTGALRVADERGIDLLVRPHVRHVLSDASRCQRLAMESTSARVVGEPLALLARSMLADGEEHIARIKAALRHGSGPGAWLISGAEPVRADADLLRPCALQESATPVDQLLEDVGQAGQAPVIVVE